MTTGIVAVSATASPPPGLCTVNAGPQSTISCGGTACTYAGNTVTAVSCLKSTNGGASGTPFPAECGTSTGANNVLPIAVDSLTAAKWSQGTSYTLNRMDANNGNGPWVDAP